MVGFRRLLAAAPQFGLACRWITTWPKPKKKPTRKSRGCDTGKLLYSSVEKLATGIMGFRFLNKISSLTPAYVLGFRNLVVAGSTSRYRYEVMSTWSRKDSPRRYVVLRCSCAGTADRAKMLFDRFDIFRPHERTLHFQSLLNAFVRDFSRQPIRVAQIHSLSVQAESLAYLRLYSSFLTAVCR